MVFFCAGLSGEGWRSTGAKPSVSSRSAQPAVTLGLAAGDDIVQLAVRDLGEVVVEGHAAVDHHGRALPQAGAFGEAIEHGGKRRAVLGVAGEHLVGDRKALPANHEANHDLLAVGAVIA